MRIQPPGRVPALVLAGAVWAAACSSTPRAPAAQPVSTLARPAAAAPAERQDGRTDIVRLAGDVHPRRERVELDVDPDREDFSGRVVIDLALDQARDDIVVSARARRSSPPWAASPTRRSPSAPAASPSTIACA